MRRAPRRETRDVAARRGARRFGDGWEEGCSCFGASDARVAGTRGLNREHGTATARRLTHSRRRDCDWRMHRRGRRAVRTRARVRQRRADRPDRDEAPREAQVQVRDREPRQDYDVSAPGDDARRADGGGGDNTEARGPTRPRARESTVPRGLDHMLFFIGKVPTNGWLSERPCALLVSPEHQQRREFPLWD